MHPEEKLNHPGVEHKYYVTEKNDLGIIWSVFYDFDNATSIKTEHDGYRWHRENVVRWDEKQFSESNRLTIKNIKKAANTNTEASYQLLINNCHAYGEKISLYLKMGEFPMEGVF